MFRVTSVKLSSWPCITRHLTFLVQLASARKTLISVRSVSNELTLDAAAWTGSWGGARLRGTSRLPSGLRRPVLPWIAPYLVENVPSGQENEV